MSRATVLDSRVNARVGKIFGYFTDGDDVALYRIQTDERYNDLQDDIVGWSTSKYGTVPSGFAGWTGEGVLEDQQFMRGWLKDLSLWKALFARIGNQVAVPGYDAGGMWDQIAEYDARVRQWQKIAVARGVKAVVTVDPPPAKGSLSGGPLDGFFGSISSIVWIVGLGIVAYFGLVYVAPSLLGAAAKTKAAGRALKEA